jgi:hypothetical protein
MQAEEQEEGGVELVPVGDVTRNEKSPREDEDDWQERERDEHPDEVAFGAEKLGEGSGHG